MKKYIALIITNGVLIGLYSLVDFIFGLIDLVDLFKAGIDFGFQSMFTLLFTIFFTITFTIMAIFVYKNKTLIIPVGVFVLYLWGINAVGFVSYVAYPRLYPVYYIPQFILLTAALVLTIILFVFAKTSKDENTDESTVKHNQFSLEEISKAKNLLDAGAITNEEFYEIKSRFFK